MPIGIVQFFLSEKGYGYIRIPESREEFYVHHKQLTEEIQAGDRVQFELGENKQGLFAKAVRKVG